MFTNPIAYSNGSVTVSYDYNGSQLNQSQYKDNSSALALPHTFDIAHRNNGSGEDQVRSSRYGIRRTVEDALGNQGQIKVDLVVSTPVKVATSAQVTEQVTLMKNFLAGTGVIAKIVAGEI